MRIRLRERRNRRDFQHAQEQAVSVGAQVCGTIAKDGRPLYFVMAADAADDAIEAKAFELREGRRITQGELLLIRQARARTAAR